MISYINRYRESLENQDDLGTFNRSYREIKVFESLYNFFVLKTRLSYFVNAQKRSKEIKSFMFSGTPCILNINTKRCLKKDWVLLYLAGHVSWYISAEYQETVEISRTSVLHYVIAINKFILCTVVTSNDLYYIYLLFKIAPASSFYNIAFGNFSSNLLIFSYLGLGTIHTYFKTTLPHRQ